MLDRSLNTLSYVSERLVPDAVTTSGLLLVAIGCVAAANGATAVGLMEAYYKGLWMLLTFTMQMTLVLLLSLMLAAAPVVRGWIVRCASLPRNTTQVVIGAGLLGAFVAYLNWGLGIALGPVIAIHFARQAEKRGIAVDFLFLMAMMAGVGSVWQFGLSASAPLMSATEGHFLEKTTGVMPLASTIWAPASVALVISFTAAAILTGCILMPKACRPLSAFPESQAKAEETAGILEGESREGLSLSKRLERSWWGAAPVWLALTAWLGFHFFIRQASFDINSMVTSLLLANFAAHGNVYRFTRALEKAVASVWPVLLLYHLYAGVAGLIQFTPAGEFLANVSAPLVNRWTYVLVTTAVSTLVALFVPTSGGQWLIQGYVTVKMAEAVGVTAQRGMLALSVGDHMGNLISPFWALVGAGVASIDFRLFFGYRLIFAALWFVMGVCAFTFLPC
ncbi:MAG: TIGR00366 family protein [Bryobacteraceae bacterium]|nr:TIGR00366 family protein [Bryobacteraceae bacterium]MDW8380143.1 TIGR00366 family protein [Bryobacterales bacterium]